MPILKHVGLVLLAVALASGPTAPYCGTWWGLVPLGIGVAAFVAGVYLLLGNLAAASFLLAASAFGLALTAVGLIALLCMRPLDLTITEFRLEPSVFFVPGAAVAGVVGVQLWVLRALGQETVQSAIARAGSWRWDTTNAARAGGGLAAVVGGLLWFSLHGQSAQLAESLALRQLGPGYRYSLTWISSRGSGHGTSVSGSVTAWNDREIRKVLLHWETP